MTLTEFLLARIAEDEAVAEEATRKPRNGVASREEMAFFTDGSGDVATHGLRLLAECEAKRRVVEVHTPEVRHSWSGGGSWEDCSVCFDPATEAGEYEFERFPCPTLRALTVVYADHPDYDETWRP